MTNTWALLPFPTQKGQVGGHEGVGEVVKIGPGVQGGVKGMFNPMFRLSFVMSTKKI
jgi:D-arabinose 1-dehydrogenase-like Zn-dependent alcohol dehydrogenase